MINVPASVILWKNKSDEPVRDHQFVIQGLIEIGNGDVSHVRVTVDAPDGATADWLHKAMSANYPAPTLRIIIEPNKQGDEG